MLGWNEEIKKHLGSCGKNVFIGHNVMFTQPENVHLGDNVRIDPFTLITSKLETGNNVQICSHAVLGGREQTIKLGNWTFIGFGSKLFTASEDYSGNDGPVNEFWGRNKTWKGNIELKDFSGIASDTMIFPKVILPEGCTIGARSFVYTKQKLEEWSVWLGDPLRLHKSRNKEKVIELSKDKNFLRYD